MAVFKPLSKLLRPAESLSWLITSSSCTIELLTCASIDTGWETLPAFVLCCHPAAASLCLPLPVGRDRADSTTCVTAILEIAQEGTHGEMPQLFPYRFFQGKRREILHFCFRVRAWSPSPTTVSSSFLRAKESGQPHLSLFPISSLLTCSLVAMSEFCKASEASRGFLRGLPLPRLSVSANTP